MPVGKLQTAFKVKKSTIANQELWDQQVQLWNLPLCKFLECVGVRCSFVETFPVFCILILTIAATTTQLDWSLVRRISISGRYLVTACDIRCLDGPIMNLGPNQIRHPQQQSELFLYNCIDLRVSIDVRTYPSVYSLGYKTNLVIFRPTWCIVFIHFVVSHCYRISTYA